MILGIYAKVCLDVSKTPFKYFENIPLSEGTQSKIETLKNLLISPFLRQKSL
jgi:hypothetical protein